MSENPPALERWLQTATKDLAEEGKARVQAEIEAQAAELVQRELDLDVDEEEHRQAQHAWQADRRRFEQQIRDLTAQLRAAPAATQA